MILSDQIWRVRCDKCYKLAEIMWFSKYKAEEDIDYIVDVYQWEVVGGRHLCYDCKEGE